ncbi:MAG: quinohemoprotein amine dehydrogenase subunit alpha [Gammaproteobacteria bacterium]|nr:quinohemoprotein amine dehydrogenase subunit alpha [Gammaproteobacteria bacterium]
MVKYLADTQGLAPAEAEPYRYLIEQDLNQVESFDPELAVMCGRCHSSARFALQRRTEAEWEHLVHFHLGQYPSIEYSLYGRDRDWLHLALTQSVPELAQRFPLESESWAQWQAADKPELEGRWVLSGHMAGKGYLYAIMTVVADKKDYYSLSLAGRYANGESVSGTGKAVVYTGYDWRAQLQLDGVAMRQVLAADSSGNRLTGRMFQKEQELIGMRITALRDVGVSQLNSVFPSHIRRGRSQTLLLTGTQLSGEIQLPAGLALEEIVSRDKNHVAIRVHAAKDATTGAAELRVGPAILSGALVVHERLDALSVEPAYGIARVGDNGGATPKVQAVFRAVGMDFGPDNVAGTKDDIRLGYIDDASWTVAPWDAAAERDEDVKFTGKMDPGTGVFSPADAGPNPLRKRSTNNAGNLKVIASYRDGEQDVTGQAHLIVTVQRWNSPPLK